MADDRDRIYAEITGLAKGLRVEDPGLTEAGAIAKVIQEKPDLYRAYLNAPQAPLSIKKADDQRQESLRELIQRRIEKEARSFAKGKFLDGNDVSRALEKKELRDLYSFVSLPESNLPARDAAHAIIDRYRDADRKRVASILAEAFVV